MTRSFDVKWSSPHLSWNLSKCWPNYFKNIKPELSSMDRKGVSILPAPELRFEAFKLGLNDIKIVIVGQDPYPTKGHAHGLAFSCLPHVTPLPPTLRNIFEEATADLGELHFPRPRNGDLREWCSRGVFLFNNALTVEEGKTGSHKHLWERFSYEVLRDVSSRRNPIVWMLWGKEQERFSALVPKHHLCLTAGHPSPLSIKLFRGRKHFSQAVEFLNLPKDFWKL